MLFIWCSAGMGWAGGPCDMPPYDPLQPVATPEAALEMDRWARKALRRDAKGKTCYKVQEVVDVLLVRWLQAHPDIVIAFDGSDADEWLQHPAEFMHHVKAEAWAEVKGRRSMFPRRWGKTPNHPRASKRRERFIDRALAGYKKA
ncbi:hypothetical protein N9C70_03440 [Flavobacteriales bacterium]|nr:hypothetical protein [Flavobacteriales bacterium]